MANWCVNHLLVCGCEEAIADLLRKELLVENEDAETQVIDFAKNLGVKSGELQGASFITIDILHRIDGYGLMIVGQSRWSPPMDAIKRIAAQYPECAFYLHGYELGVGYAYHLACEGMVIPGEGDQPDEYHFPSEGTLPYTMGSLGG